YEPPDHFQVPETGPRLSIRQFRLREAANRSERRDTATGALDIVNELGYFGSFQFRDSGLTYLSNGRDTYSIIDGNPLSATIQSERSVEVSRGAWATKVNTVSTMSST